MASIRSDREHWTRMVAVEVRQKTLGSDGCGRGLARNTETHMVAVEVTAQRQRGGEGGGVREGEGQGQGGDT